MFSLLHFLASNPRNADMLKRALRGDTDARRLFSYLGVTPTHLADIDEGAIARRSAAISVPRTVEVTAPDSCAVRLVEAEKTIKALEARLAEQTPPEPPKAYERDGMKPEHRIARIRRLFCLSDEWLESDLERLHADYRAMYRALDREKGSGGEAAIKALRDRAESAAASVQELRQRLQAEIMAHDTTRSQVGKTPKPEQTRPEEVIVLGPWRNENGVMRREKLTEPWKGYAFMHAYPATPKGAWSCIRPERAHEVDGVYHDIGGMPVADDWARDRYALIDAEPGSLKGALAPWYETDRMWYRGSVIGFVQVYKHGYGWQIYKSGDKTCSPLAHGPQTGEEGKRYALAAAHALGLTGGGE